MPRFCDVLNEAERIAVQWQEYEVAEAIVTEDRKHVMAKLSPHKRKVYDIIMQAAYHKLDASPEVQQRQV